MEHELIDELDENGNYKGIIDQAIAHRDGLWHRSVHVWIVNDNNEILLQYRCANKKFFPDVWDVSFAGHVGVGEDSITSAIREGKEELGIDVDTSKMQFLFTNKETLIYGNAISNEFVDIYLLRDNIRLENLIYQTTEVGGAKYMKILQFFDVINNLEEKIFPHREEYKKLKKVLLNK